MSTLTAERPSQKKGTHRNSIPLPKPEAKPEAKKVEPDPGMTILDLTTADETLLMEPDLVDAVLRAGIDPNKKELPEGEELTKKIANLHALRTRLNAIVDRIDAEIDALAEPQILRWLKTGTQRHTVDGVTVHLRDELWASAKNLATVRKWLKERGVDPGDVVKPTINSQTLSGMVREWVRQLKAADPKGTKGKQVAELMPPKLYAALGVYEITKLAFRKAD